eukprot:Clim_evm38s25 gene=Clim_evmTU38s25
MDNINEIVRRLKEQLAPSQRTSKDGDITCNCAEEVLKFFEKGFETRYHTLSLGQALGLHDVWASNIMIRPNGTLYGKLSLDHVVESQNVDVNVIYDTKSNISSLMVFRPKLPLPCEVHVNTTLTPPQGLSATSMALDIRKRHAYALRSTMYVFPGPSFSLQFMGLLTGDLGVGMDVTHHPFSSRYTDLKVKLHHAGPDLEVGGEVDVTAGQMRVGAVHHISDVLSIGHHVRYAFRERMGVLSLAFSYQMSETLSTKVRLSHAGSIMWSGMIQLQESLFLTVSSTLDTVRKLSSFAIHLESM